MTANTNSNVVVFPRIPKPSPKLAGDPIPDEALPALLLGNDIACIAAMLKRIRIAHGDYGVEFALAEVKSLISQS